MTTSRDHDGPTAAVPADVPDWGSATGPAAEPTGLPGNPGFLSPGVPALAVRDRHGRAVVETPLSPRAQTRYLARLVLGSGALVAVVAGTTLTLLAGHLLGPGALPGGRTAPWWLVVALVAVALPACVLLLGVHTVALGASGSARVASRLTWATALLAVALGVGTVVGLDLADVAHPLARDLELEPLLALACVSVGALAWGVVAVLSTTEAQIEARAVQERLRVLRRDGVRTPGSLVDRRYQGSWTDDGRPRFDATVTYGPPGAERSVEVLLVAPQDRVPLPGAPVVVVHEVRDDADVAAPGPAPRGRGGRRDPNRWILDLVLVELDQSRPVHYDPDVAAFAKEASSSGS
ncbi:hypothetical protein JN535_18420 [Cellulosimicrobium cellulans]|uniref:hypothetical protein n=1 Tax=Cellulosimicrobium cellulans TaxID=1710 RepID=UPI001965E35D|nr:hypothetical protein [Cellulosimicrobium cellulans]MBN0042137.1 hypothetical protein [Cellulosimicrobium cellulans]